MDAALQINFHYVEQEKSYKIINFSSNIIKTIQNVPLVIVGIILLPIYLIFFVPLANLLLLWLYKKMQKAVSELNMDISSLPYEETKDGYDLINSLILYLATIEKEIAPDANDFLIRGMFRKLIKISAVLGEMKDSLAKTLFVGFNNMPYNEKEKESLDILNEIWGDDSDQVYARHTHYHLTKKLKENGI
jgi:hypothetical protein